LFQTAFLNAEHRYLTRSSRVTLFVGEYDAERDLLKVKKGGGDSDANHEAELRTQWVGVFARGHKQLAPK